MVKVEYNQDNFPTAYECEQLVNQNSVREVHVTFFYDLLFLQTMGFTTARQVFEANLLNGIATQLGLTTSTSVNSCLLPPPTGPWMIRISSLPQDEQFQIVGTYIILVYYHVSQHSLSYITTTLLFFSLHTIFILENCFELRPNPETEACVLLEGQMTAFAVGGNSSQDEAGLLNLIDTEITSGAATAGSTLTATYLSTQLDLSGDAGDRDNLNPAINEPDNILVDPNNSDKITPIGVMMVMGLALGVVGILFVVVKLRRRKRAADQDAIMREQVIDESLHQHQSYPYHHDEHQQQQQQYSFDDMPDDTGFMFKNELLGIHAPDPSHHRRDGLDVSVSESDVDSWAQTDATLGSIEQHLEPITAEV